MNLNKMCDHCYRMLGDNEELFGFKVSDGHGNYRMLKGHKPCIEEVIEIFNQLYGKRENDEQE